nr:RNA-directed DNA polymerase, eukaryota, reverse transcriptase zinc-binding domain protein [Tanacetum cinerariifolium]
MVILLGSIGGTGGSSKMILSKPLSGSSRTDFRPISLIGSVYKIIAKILANRLVLVLGDLVNEVQSAFIADRQILDGPFILNELVHGTAAKIGCAVLNTPFTYLGSRVGGNMSRIQAWNDIIEGMVSRLSKWKVKTLSIGGKLTLPKSVLGALPIYHMSIFKVPMKVMKNMEAIRARFFNGVSGSFSDHVPGVATSAPTEASLASPPVPPTVDAPGMTPAMTTSILYAPDDAPTSTTPNAENLNKVGGGDVVILALGVAGIRSERELLWRYNPLTMLTIGYLAGYSRNKETNEGREMRSDDNSMVEAHNMENEVKTLTPINMWFHDANMFLSCGIKQGVLLMVVAVMEEGDGETN